MRSFVYYRSAANHVDPEAEGRRFEVLGLGANFPDTQTGGVLIGGFGRV